MVNNMRYIIFSDLHGNIDAFYAMQMQLIGQDIDGYIYCGDLAGYYYEQHEIIKEFKKLPNLYAVKGNHDGYYLRAKNDKDLQLTLSEKYGSSYNAINNEVCDYISSLPDNLTLNLNGCNIYVVHGSPLDLLEGRVYPDTSLPQNPPNYDFIFCGHTHYRMNRSVGNCNIVNPGSLGQPRDGMGFSYCSFDTLTLQIEYCTIQLDLLPLLNKIEVNDSNMSYLKSVLFRNQEDIR